jgi:hypothetical protein
MRTGQVLVVLLVVPDETLLGGDLLLGASDVALAAGGGGPVDPDARGVLALNVLVPRAVTLLAVNTRRARSR